MNNERKKNTDLSKGNPEIIHPDKTAQDRMPADQRPRFVNAQKWAAQMQKERPSGIGLNGNN